MTRYLLRQNVNASKKVQNTNLYDINMPTEYSIVSETFNLSSTSLINRKANQMHLFEAFHELAKMFRPTESVVDDYLSRSPGSEGHSVVEEPRNNEETVGSVPVFFVQGSMVRAQGITDFMEEFFNVKEGETSTKRRFFPYMVWSLDLPSYEKDDRMIDTYLLPRYV